MNRIWQSVLLLLTGAGVLRVSLLGDIALRYVREGLQPFLIVSGLVLVALGLLGSVRDGIRPGGVRRPPRGEWHAEADAHGHGHSRGPRIAWLLLPPTLALLLFAPPALGSYTAARENPKIVEDYPGFEPLPASGPVRLSVTEFTARVQQQSEQGIRGRTLVLEGFATRGEDGAWSLARLLVACCAADSQALTVRMHDVAAPPEDTWVRVTGTWHPGGTLGTVSAALALDVTSLRHTPEPSSPYVDRAPSPGPVGAREPG